MLRVFFCIFFANLHRINRGGFLEEIRIRFQNEEAAARVVSRMAEYTAAFYWAGHVLHVLPLSHKETALRQFLKGEDIFPSPPS